MKTFLIFSKIKTKFIFKDKKVSSDTVNFIQTNRFFVNLLTCNSARFEIFLMLNLHWKGNQPMLFPVQMESENSQS